MKNLYESLREHAQNITDFEENKMLLTGYNFKI